MDEIKDNRNEVEVMKAVRPAIMSKQLGNDEIVARLIAKACSKSGFLIL